MSNTINRFLTAITLAALTLTAGTGIASAHIDPEPHPAFTAIPGGPETTVDLPGIALPGVSVGEMSVGPDGVAIGGPTVGLPNAHSVLR